MAVADAGWQGQGDKHSQWASSPRKTEGKGASHLPPPSQWARPVAQTLPGRKGQHSSVASGWSPPIQVRPWASEIPLPRRLALPRGFCSRLQKGKTGWHRARRWLVVRWTAVGGTHHLCDSGFGDAPCVCRTQEEDLVPCGLCRSHGAGAVATGLGAGTATGQGLSVWGRPRPLSRGAAGRQ